MIVIISHVFYCIFLNFTYKHSHIVTYIIWDPSPLLVMLSLLQN